MAYMNQEMKAKIAANLKKVVPEGWKYSLAVRNHSTIVFTLRQAPVDILGNIRETIAKKDFGNSYGNKVEVGLYWSVNPYYIDTQFSGEVLAVIQKISAALNDGNWDKSDIQTDYFNVGWYVDINIGRWDEPFLDTVPAPARAAKKANVPSLSNAGPVAKKAWFAAYEPFLPSDWKGMSPGKKAAATKAAMQKCREAQA